MLGDDLGDDAQAAAIGEAAVTEIAGHVVAETAGLAAQDIGEGLQALDDLGAQGLLGAVLGLFSRYPHLMVGQAAIAITLRLEAIEAGLLTLGRTLLALHLAPCLLHGGRQLGVAELAGAVTADLEPLAVSIADPEFPPDALEAKVAAAAGLSGAVRHLEKVLGDAEGAEGCAAKAGFLPGVGEDLVGHQSLHQ